MVTETADPMDAAMDAEYVPPKLTFFGQVQADAWHCVLVKGTGKVPFDAGQHSIDKRCTALDIAVTPLPDSPNTKPISRELIAESKEWASIIKPSLRSLNTDLRGVNRKWAQVEMVSTGRKYTNANGEEKVGTTIKFIAVYNTEQECAEAAKKFFADRKAGDSTPAPTAAAQPQQTAMPSGANPERDIALKFLPALWAAAGKDVTKLATLIQRNPLVAKYFGIDSPEVVKLITPA